MTDYFAGDVELAVSKRNCERLRFLLDRGAEASGPALAAAVRSGMPTMVKALLRAGAPMTRDVHAALRDSRKASMRAAFNCILGRACP